ncbi:MAG: pyridoxamine 5'-phosphate oxidase family protein, partial [Anaerolineales bacterium]
MLSFNDEFGLHVIERLNQDPILWLTTVSKDGTPQPNPVWFYWDGEKILIYSQPFASKLKNIERNPKVSVNLEGAAIDGGDVVILIGNAIIDRTAPLPSTGYR